MEHHENDFRSGFVTIVGRPNVGKSSLMNRMIGEKIAIVSARPQTTRSRIMGVLTDPCHQIVFLDTPGIHDPKTRLGEYMMHAVRDAMDGMDAVLVILDVTHITDSDLQIARNMKEKKVPAVLALNKIDLVSPEQILSATARAAEAGLDEIIPVSAKTGNGIEDLVKCLQNHLPAGPRYFPDDMITDLVANHFSKQQVFSDIIITMDKKPDYVLSGRILAMDEVIEGEKSYARVAINFELKDYKTEDIVVAYSFDKKKEAEGKKPVDVVRAMSEIIASEIEVFVSKIYGTLESGR